LCCEEALTANTSLPGIRASSQRKVRMPSRGIPALGSIPIRKNPVRFAKA
jgi:hypothetical protein